MFQRLFSRGVARDRLGAAVEHSAEVEQRAALRQRSAAILRRLESRKEEARRIERTRKRAEREAIEREAAEWEAAEAARHAHAAEADGIAGEDMHSGSPMTEAAPAMDGAEIWYEEQDMTGHDPAVRHAQDADVEQSADMAADQDGFEDLWADEEAESDLPDPVATRMQAENLFVDSQPLRSDEAHSAEAHERGPAIDEDPEVYAQLRKKAEEAKARIARRLETMKADEEARAAHTLVDLGAAAPPLAPDLGSDD